MRPEYAGALDVVVVGVGPWCVMYGPAGIWLGAPCANATAPMATMPAKHVAATNLNILNPLRSRCTSFGAPDMLSTRRGVAGFNGHRRMYGF